MQENDVEIHEAGGEAEKIGPDVEDRVKVMGISDAIYRPLHTQLSSAELVPSPK